MGAVIIEEIARADVSASLIPAVNKFGSLPVQIGGCEQLKRMYFGKFANGEGGFSYCLAEPHAGSDAANRKTAQCATVATDLRHCSAATGGRLTTLTAIGHAGHAHAGGQAGRLSVVLASHLWPPRAGQHCPEPPF